MSVVTILPEVKGTEIALSENTSTSLSKFDVTFQKLLDIKAECETFTKPAVTDTLSIKQLTLSRQKAKQARLAIKKKLSSLNFDALTEIRNNRYAAKELIGLVMPGEDHCKALLKSVKVEKELIKQKKLADKAKEELEQFQKRMDLISPYLGALKESLNTKALKEMGEKTFEAFLQELKKDYENLPKEEPVAENFDLSGPADLNNTPGAVIVIPEVIPEIELTDPDADFEGDKNLLNDFEIKVLELTVPSFKTEHYKQHVAAIANHLKKIHKIIIESKK